MLANKMFLQQSLKRGTKNKKLLIYKGCFKKKKKIKNKNKNTLLQRRFSYLSLQNFKNVKINISNKTISFF